MNQKTARKLKIGDRVATDMMPFAEHHEGHVSLITPAQVTIDWDDDYQSTHHHHLMHKIDRP